MKILKRLTNCIKKVYFIYNKYTVPLLFEYDEAKSIINLEKHGIDFVEAQRLWDDKNAIDAVTDTKNEKRFIHVGKLSDKAYSAIYTIRGSRIRLISVRRARAKEVQKYEEHHRRRT